MGPDLTGTASVNVPARTSFYYSFSILPREKRTALRTVYAFCRATDDIVDNYSDHGEKVAGLLKWREELERAARRVSEIPLMNDLASVAAKFGIPFRHFHDLLDGVAMDLGKTRYASFDELARYCELVASSVGLMCIRIFGLRNERTEEYARMLGIALQLTNIIRDVGVDAGYGRIYIPSDEMRRFACPEEEILGRVYSDTFRDLMEFQAARAGEYYTAAAARLEKSDRPAMYPARIMEKIYAGTLARIRKSEYRVFGEPVRLPGWRQFFIAAPYIIPVRIGIP